MKKILVPCDFSDTAIQAFKFACELATTSKGELFLLNVIELPTVHGSFMVPIHAYEDAFLKDIKLKAQRNFEKLKDRYGKKVKVHFSVEHGSVTEGIRKYVDRKRIDLVVMGTHGASGIKEYTIGSNVEKVVRSAKVPVIAIKKAVNVSSLSNIVLPTNLKPTHKDLANAVKALQKYLKARLHILYVNVPANFSPDRITEKHLLDFARQHEFKNCAIHIYNDTDEESGIINFSSKFKNKIVAMSTHGRKGINRLMSGSIAEDVVNHVDCPIWTLSER